MNTASVAATLNAGGFWDQSGGTAVWVLSILGVVAVIGALRLPSALHLRYRANRLLPVVIRQDHTLLGGQANGGTDTGGGPHPRHHEPRHTGELAAYITAHLAADSLGPRVLTPGSGTTTGPDPAPETTSSPHGWVDVLKRLAFFRPRAYHVLLCSLSGEGERPRFSVRILFVPRNTVVAATVLEAAVDPEGGPRRTEAQLREELYERIACYCTVKILSDPRTQDRIPRWESWGDDPDAYRFYRMGITAQEAALAAKKNGEPDRERDLYLTAGGFYGDAAALVPGNLTVRLHQAGVLELIGQHDVPGNESGEQARQRAGHLQNAIQIYEDCVQLWPEHIETAYRLSIACAEKGAGTQPQVPGSDDGHDTHLPEDYERDSVTHLKWLRLRLTRRRVLRRWARTWLPGRRNLGERRYWRQWMALERPLPALRSHRRAFLGAVRIAEAAEVLRAAQPGAADPGRPGRERRPAPETVERAFRTVAKEVTGGFWRRWRWLGASPWWGMRRLLYADHHHRRAHAGLDHEQALKSGSEPSRIPNRASAGYLVYYNAACFLSLALSVDGSGIPGGFERTGSVDEWREDCARAAIVQLNNSLRVSRSQFSSAWAERDSDLRPLFTGRLPGGPRTAGRPNHRWARTGRNWAHFVNIHLPD